jgi:hypothetical protein
MAPAAVTRRLIQALALALALALAALTAGPIVDMPGKLRRTRISAVAVTGT